MCFSLSLVFPAKRVFPVFPSSVQLPFFPLPFLTGSCHPACLHAIIFFPTCKSNLHVPAQCVLHISSCLCANVQLFLQSDLPSAFGPDGRSGNSRRAASGVLGGERVWPVMAHPRAENETLSSISVCVPSSKAALSTEAVSLTPRSPLYLRVSAWVSVYAQFGL